jgi:pimeloyl-ACP methyl ester carboxylesterase
MGNIPGSINVYHLTCGEGKPLVFLPAWGMSARGTAFWHDPCFRNSKGWQRLYVEPPGHGRTPAAGLPANQDAILDVLLDFIDRELHGQRFALAGASNGAYLARGILYHRREQVDGLLMLVPVIQPDRSKRALPPHTVVYQDPSLKPDEVEMLSPLTVRSQRMLEYAHSFPRPADDELGDPDFLDAVQADPVRFAFSTDVDALPQPFVKPTLIITGRQDSTTGYRDAWTLLEDYPRATFAVLDRAGHYLEEKDSLIRVLVGEWLARVEEVR